MASKNELRTEIETLSVELGVSVDTRNMGHSQLSQTLENLRSANVAKRATVDAPAAPVPEAQAPPATPNDTPAPAGEAPPEVPVVQPAAAASVTPAAKSPKGFAVAPDQGSLICARGVLGPGEPIHPDDVAGGLKQLEHLVERGLVVRS